MYVYITALQKIKSLLSSQPKVSCPCPYLQNQSFIVKEKQVMIPELIHMLSIYNSLMARIKKENEIQCVRQAYHADTTFNLNDQI